jgi:hypothetical protein
MTQSSKEHFLWKHLPANMNISVDVLNHVYTFPQEIAVTGTQPDIIVWEPSTITLMELTASTINFELHRNCYSEEETQISKSTKWM